MVDVSRLAALASAQMRRRAPDLPGCSVGGGENGGGGEKNNGGGEQREQRPAAGEFARYDYEASAALDAGRDPGGVVLLSAVLGREKSGTKGESWVVLPSSPPLLLLLLLLPPPPSSPLSAVLGREKSGTKGESGLCFLLPLRCCCCCCCLPSSQLAPPLPYPRGHGAAAGGA